MGVVLSALIEKLFLSLTWAENNILLALCAFKKTYRDKKLTPTPFKLNGCSLNPGKQSIQICYTSLVYLKIRNIFTLIVLNFNIILYYIIRPLLEMSRFCVVLFKTNYSLLRKLQKVFCNLIIYGCVLPTSRS